MNYLDPLKEPFSSVVLLVTRVNIMYYSPLFNQEDFL
jgi:hypothetical protein